MFMGVLTVFDYCCGKTWCQFVSICVYYFDGVSVSSAARDGK